MVAESHSYTVGCVIADQVPREQSVQGRRVNAHRGRSGNDAGLRVGQQHPKSVPCWLGWKMATHGRVGRPSPLDSPAFIHPS
jgi:hypothetical protein